MLSVKQTTIKKIIELEIAIVCLYWAQSYIECRTPLYDLAHLTYEQCHRYRPECDDGDQMVRVSFQLHFPARKATDSFESREPKRGMVVRMKVDDSKLVVSSV